MVIEDIIREYLGEKITISTQIDKKVI